MESQTSLLLGAVVNEKDQTSWESKGISLPPQMPTPAPQEIAGLVKGLLTTTNYPLIRPY